MAENFISTGLVFIEGKEVTKRLSLDPQLKKENDRNLNASKRKMFISGLSPSISELTLREALKRHSGEDVEEITIIRHKAETLDPLLNTAFVTFKTEGTAIRLNKMTLVVESTAGVLSKIKLEISKTPKELKILGNSKTETEIMSIKNLKKSRNNLLRFNINLPTSFSKIYKYLKPGQPALCLYYPSAQYSIVCVESFEGY